jgi:hypothetical protein
MKCLERLGKINPFDKDYVAVPEKQYQDLQYKCADLEIQNCELEKRVEAMLREINTLQATIVELENARDVK